MNSKLITITTLLICFTFGQKNVKPKTNFGGYGELHMNTENAMDFQRFVVYFEHQWDKNWSVKGEVELEHNKVTSQGGNNVVSVPYDGSIELEQAYINYQGEKWGFKTGVLLANVGLINANHEPPTFLSVERPDFSEYIIPTTWFGNGFSFYGSIGGEWHWNLTLMEDLFGDALITDTGSESGPNGQYALKDARGNGYKTVCTDFTKIYSIAWSGIDGVHVGGSMTLNEMPITDGNGQNNGSLNLNSSTIGMKMTAIHAVYNKNSIITIFESANIDFDYNDYNIANSQTFKKASEGYYLDIGYNIGSFLPKDLNLYTWLRISGWDSNTYLNDSQNVGDVKKTLVGITWWPIDNITIKMDMGSLERTWDDNDPNTKDVKETDIVSLGFGYMF